MNGIVPGPLWLAIASAANENRNLTHQPQSDTFTGTRTNSQGEIANRQTRGSDLGVTDSRVVNASHQKLRRKR